MKDGYANSESVSAKLPWDLKWVGVELVSYVVVFLENCWEFPCQVALVTGQIYYTHYAEICCKLLLKQGVRNQAGLDSYEVQLIGFVNGLQQYK